MDSPTALGSSDHLPFLPEGAVVGDGILGCAKRHKSGEVEISQTIQRVLDHIEMLNPSVNAVVDVYSDRALSRARELQALSPESWERLSLLGVPVLVKANMAVAGEKLSCASRLLEGYVSPYSATVVEALESEGAIIVGASNMDEFSMGSSCEYSCFGPTKNPHDHSKEPGGSSGGAAAAAALGLAPLCLGSDTGGSVRQPASFCRVVGFKPSYGSVSRYGLVAFASSLDQISPVARSVADVRAAYSVLAQRDPRDATSCHFDPNDGSGPQSGSPELAQLRVGVPFRFVEEHVTSEATLLAFARAVEQLRQLGVQVCDVDLSSQERALAAYYVISSAEASSNLSRFDGLKYGRRAEGQSLDEVVCRSRTEGFGSEVKRRICLGTFALSAGYYEACYGKAMAVRRELRSEYARYFADVDLILTPTTPQPAFSLGEKTKDPTSMYTNDVFTISPSLAGLPAISVPRLCENGSDCGFQLVGAYGADEHVLEVTQLLESSLWCGVRSKGGDR